jgi:hypothetical protein
MISAPSAIHASSVVALEILAIPPKVQRSDLCGGLADQVGVMGTSP